MAANPTLSASIDQALAFAATADFQASLWSGLIILGLSAFFRFFEAKPRLVWGTNHQFVFTLKTPEAGEGQKTTDPLFTRTINVVNEGTAAASNVEVHFTARPAHLQVWPTFDYEEVTLPDGGFLIRIPNLGAKESFVVELLQFFNPLPNVIRVRSSRGEAPSINIGPSRILGAWQIRALLLLVMLGAFTVLRWIVEFVITARA